MNRIVATIFLAIIALPATANVELNFIHYDHLGTPRVVTDDTQQVVWKGHLKPYGKVEVEIEALTLHQRFPGQRVDIETNLHYNYFRNYEHRVGQYIQSDPIGQAGGLNTYTYVGSSPLLDIDPFGLFNTQATKHQDGHHTFRMDFSPGQVVGFVNAYQPFSPIKNLNRLKKAGEVLGAVPDVGPVGLVDVEGPSNKWACLKYEDELRDAYNDLGHQENDELTEDELLDVIEKFNELLPKNIQDLYGTDTLVERAKKRAYKAAGVK